MRPSISHSLLGDYHDHRDAAFEKARAALKEHFLVDASLQDTINDQIAKEDWEGVAAALTAEYGGAPLGAGSLAEQEPVGTEEMDGVNETWFEEPRDTIAGYDDAFETGMNLSDWFESQEWGSFVSPVGRPGSREVRDVSIAYVVVRGSGTKGGVVYCPGTGENIRKMDDWAASMLRKGYSPIFVYAHRGQGESDRLISNPQSVYAEDGRDFVHDLRAFTEVAAEKMAASEEDKDKPLHLVCHSLGGAVCLAYLVEEYEDQRPSRYAGAVLNAPAVKVDTGVFPYKVAVALGQILHGLGRGQTDAPTRSRTFEQDYLPGAFAGNHATHSFTRFLYTIRKCGRYRATLLGADQHPGLCNHGFSANYAKSLFDLHEKTFKAFVQVQGKKVHVPLLVQTAGPPEGMDGYVQNDFARAFCEDDATTCTYSNYPDSKHGLFFEVDEIRDRGLGEIDDFFASLAGTGPGIASPAEGVKHNGEHCWRDLDCFTRHCRPKLVFTILGGTCEPQGTFLADQPTPEPLGGVLPAVALAVLALCVLGACCYGVSLGGNPGES